MKRRARSTRKALLCSVFPGIRQSIALFKRSQTSPACLPEEVSKLDSFCPGKESVAKKSSTFYVARSVIICQDRSNGPCHE
jgi:hypothetical protein